VFEAWFAEVDVSIDDAGQHMKAGRVEDFGSGGIQSVGLGQRGKSALSNADVQPSRCARANNGATANHKIQGLQHGCRAAYATMPADGERKSTPGAGVLRPGLDDVAHQP
jgi:hypothetical protein